MRNWSRVVQALSLFVLCGVSAANSADRHPNDAPAGKKQYSRTVSISEYDRYLFSLEDGAMQNVFPKLSASDHVRAFTRNEKWRPQTSSLSYYQEVFPDKLDTLKQFVASYDFLLDDWATVGDRFQNGVQIVGMERETPGFIEKVRLSTEVERDELSPEMRNLYDVACSYSKEELTYFENVFDRYLKIAAQIDY